MKKEKKNKEKKQKGNRVVVKVDVTKIVRCLCFTGVVIVGIIFGTKYWFEWMKEQEQ